MASPGDDGRDLMNLRCVNHKWKRVTEDVMNRKNVRVNKNLLAIRKSNSRNDTVCLIFNIIYKLD